MSGHCIAVQIPTVRISIPTVHLRGSIDHIVQGIGQTHLAHQDVTLEFSHCTFLSDAGAAVLASFKLRRDRHALRTAIDWTTVPSDVARQLQRWRVASLFGERDGWSENSVPLFHQTELDLKALVRHVDSEIMARMPEMTAELAKRTRYAVCEVFTNIFSHSHSNPGGLLIGQVYPNDHQFELCVCDVGVGLVRRVQRFGHGLGSPIDAIRWALERGTSTLSTQRRPSGLGLFVLRRFVQTANGRFELYANNGCFTEIHGREGGRTTDAPFRGTLLRMRLQSTPGVVYDLL